MSCRERRRALVMYISSGCTSLMRRAARRNSLLPNRRLLAAYSGVRGDQQERHNITPPLRGGRLPAPPHALSAFQPQIGGSYPPPVQFQKRLPPPSVFFKLKQQKVRVPSGGELFKQRRLKKQCSHNKSTKYCPRPQKCTQGGT